MRALQIAERDTTSRRAARAGQPRGGTAMLCLALLLAALSIAAAPALANSGHVFSSSVDQAPPGTALAGPSTLAVEEASGDVFVGDTLSGYVNVYSSSGEYMTRFGEGLVEPAGIAIDEANGDVLVADPINEVVLLYAPDGKGSYALVGAWSGASVPGGSFGAVAGVAVDNSGSASSGDVYVLEAKTAGGEPGAVDALGPVDGGSEPVFIKRFSGGKPEAPNAIAVSSSTGRVLVADSAKGAVLAYDASGALEEKLTGKGSPFGSFKGKELERGNVAGVAVDPLSGDIYVAEAERHVVSQYSSTGAWEGWVTSGEGGDALGEPRGVALDPSGDLLAADAGLGRVDRFGPSVLVPDVETGKVAKSAITRTTAMLTGTVNGNGQPAEARFQYGQTPALGSETTAQVTGPGEAPVSIEASGLQAGMTYYYRIVASNEAGSNVGLTRQLSTPPAVEGLSTGTAKEINQEGATLTGQLNPGGVDTHYYFQWGTTSALGNTTPAPHGTDAGAGTSPLEALTVLSGLTPNTRYHYRIVAVNTFGTSFGQEQTFTTAGPPRIASEVPTGIGQEAATLHAAVNPDRIATSYRFEYGPTSAYGSETPLGGEAIGSGATPVAVSATLSGLQSGTTYHYRVVASNENGETTTGPDEAFTTLPSAPVDASYASKVTDSEATLNAQINPLGHDTTYYFQYGTQDCQTSPAACTEIPSPPGEGIGSGTEDASVSQQLAGLVPNTTYYFRVIAINSLGASEGPERTFTTQAPQEGSSSLADSRAWEMVTPPDKGAAPTEALTREGGIILASQDGDGFTYVVDGALGEEVQGNRSPEWQQILATRTPGGWSSQDIATPSGKAKGVQPGLAPEYQFFNPELSSALVEPLESEGVADPPLVPGLTQATIYLRDDDSSTYAPVVGEANTAPGTKFGGGVHFLSATPDLAHIVLSSAGALTGLGSSAGLYEWTGGQLKFVSVLPHSVAPASGAELGFFGRVLANAISSDGSRVIWSVKQENSGRGRLYLRDTATGETIRLDAARGVAEPAEASAQYQAASSDGSRVLFTDKQRLTPDSTAEAGAVQEAGKPDLYECEITQVAGQDTCALTDLTVAHGEGEHAAVQNFILGADASATSIYLIAHGVLAENANGSGESARPGANNLYELHNDGSSWTTTYIATLASGDAPEWEGNNVANTAYLSTRVSPNGRYLAFMSQAPITGYDNVDVNPAAKGARDEEVYLYDSAAQNLRCVSCNPSGARPAGVLDNRNSGEGLGLLADRRKIWGELGKEHWLAGNIPGWTAQTLVSALFQPRYLSDEGRLYFNSPDSLVPAARNAKENVYQYEPAGVGSCESSSGGCVSLISAGGSDRESAFIEATPDGGSVFFLTEANLLPQDTDTAFDIYAARECSEASPCLTPPAAPPVQCRETETCRPAQPAQPIPGASGTAVFSGTGNLSSRPPAPAGETKGKTSTKPLSRAQKLSGALKACRKRYKHARQKRVACERAARRRYGPAHKAKQSKQARATHRKAGRGGGR